MTGIDSVILQNAIVHKVGNPTRSEALQLSENTLTLNDPIVRGLLTKYFLSPFNEHEQYHFTHLSDLGLNEVYTYVTAIFNNPKKIVQQSALLAQFLYSKSTHVKVIKYAVSMRMRSYLKYGARGKFEGVTPMEKSTFPGILPM